MTILNFFFAFSKENYFFLCKCKGFAFSKENYYFFLFVNVKENNIFYKFSFENAKKIKFLLGIVKKNKIFFGNVKKMK